MEKLSLDALAYAHTVAGSLSWDRSALPPVNTELASQPYLLLCGG